MQNQNPETQEEVWGKENIPKDADKNKVDLNEIITEDFVRNIEVESDYKGPKPLVPLEETETGE